ncbi:alpha/beta fold hydrolase [Lonsdalea quercina]|uniref:alpha/beta fold hydrolase n=1 Tax=Lonsdalea quercina TaxID=71657 RepID=UPI003F4685EA
MYDPELKTAIFINGALATSSSFLIWVKHLKGKVNTILFDFPFAGKSKPLNDSLDIITKEQEVDIINFLIRRYRPEIIMSVSWGGLGALMAASQNNDILEMAVIASFSMTINEKMERYILKARDYVYQKEFEAVANLLNNEVGKYLPRLFKKTNFNHVAHLDEHEYRQACFHLDQILTLRDYDYEKFISKISIPVIFINGEKDEHTTSKEVKNLGKYLDDARFYTLKDAGHFLDLESKAAALGVKSIFEEIFINQQEFV